MYDIFLSYSTQDKDRLQTLVDALDQQGWSVFWDHRSIPVGKDWHNTIEDAINQCRSVVVAWSENSIESNWVKEEAMAGRERGVLFPILLDDIKLPFGFKMIQAADFSQWNGDQNNKEFLELKRQLTAHLGIPKNRSTDSEFPKQTTTPPQKLRKDPDKPSRSPLLFSGLGLVAALSATALLVPWSDFSNESKKVAGPISGSQPIAKPIQEQLEIQQPEPIKDYQLAISTEPASATIKIDGETYNKAMRKPAGTYNIRVSAKGYETVKQAITITDADKSPTIKLKAIKKEFEPEMASIPAGSFMMGCVEGRDDVEGGCSDREKPPHKVTLSAFSIGKYEITFDEWDACEKAKACPHADDEGWGRGKRPVINVSWDDTQKYIKWLNQQTGKNYRLPTEAEWEYAARAGGDRAFPWGNSISCKNADYNYEDCNSKGTSPVGSFSANDFGLYDTAGNVWEWTEDWYGGYSSQSVTDPKGAKAGSFRVLRGGGWGNGGGDVRSAIRNGSSPDDRFNNFGLRLALGQ